MKHKFTIGITDYVKPPYSIEESAFNGNAEIIYLGNSSNKSLNTSLLKKCDALLVWNALINKDVIDHLEKCKVIVRYGVGYDAIDLISLKKASIELYNTPDYGTEEVADTAVAMILAFQRSVFEYDNIARSSNKSWVTNVYKPLSRTNKLTAGIIGVGRIGSAVINRLKPFGFLIQGYDPYQPSGHEKAIGYKRCEELKDLLSTSDIISIHSPLTEETKGMIDNEFIASLKDETILVNTARGPILKDLDCLYKGLIENKIKACGLDVLPDEPPKENRLLNDWKEQKDWIKGRLIINPHSSYYSKDAWEEMRYKAARTAFRFLNKEKNIRNRII